MTTNSDKPRRSVWGLVLLALVVAAIAVGVFYYIGWFDNRTHVDTPAGDNVEDVYAPANPESPAEQQWENADHESLEEVITQSAE